MSHNSEDLWVEKRPGEDVKYLTLNDPRAPKFVRFMGAFGWLDPNGDDVRGRHCFLVGGERADGKFHVIDEIIGDMGDILDAATNAKDRFYIEEIYCDNSDPAIMRQVYDWDGLTQYYSNGVGPAGNDLWFTDSSHWKWFRDRYTVALVAGVPPDIRASLRGSLSILVSLQREERLLFQSHCTYCDWVTSQAKLSDVATHPVYLALLYLTWGLANGPRDYFVDSPRRTVGTKNPYPNLK